MTPRLAILDRDGTLNVLAAEGEYVTDPDQVSLLPGVADAVARLVEAGVPVVVVTNQRCVALGLATEQQVDAVNRAVAAEVRLGGGRIERFYVCPHGHGMCECRKPAPGMLLAALDDHEVEPEAAFMIGDSDADAEAAAAAGVAFFRVESRAQGGWKGVDLETAVAAALAGGRERFL